MFRKEGLSALSDNPGLDVNVNSNSYVDPEIELCETIFDDLKESYRDSMQELSRMVSSLEREVRLTEDPLARRDLALVELAMASNKIDRGNISDAALIFQRALGHMHQAGEAAEPLRGIALKLSKQIPLR